MLKSIDDYQILNFYGNNNPPENVSLTFRRRKADLIMMMMMISFMLTLKMVK